MSTCHGASTSLSQEGKSCLLCLPRIVENGGWQQKPPLPPVYCRAIVELSGNVKENFGYMLSVGTKGWDRGRWVSRHSHNFIKCSAHGGLAILSQKRV